MIKEFTYQLDKSSKKFQCPGCGEKRFVLYIDAYKNYIDSTCGRCDREDRCGYHLSPSQYFDANPTKNPKAEKKQLIVTADYLPVQYLPFGLMDVSVMKHKKSNLYPFLEKLFREDVATRLCENFFIGANRDGNTTFWQVDIDGKIRQAKVMEYNSETGRRKKEGLTSFVGKKILADSEANLQQCFFGEYQLSYPENIDAPVALVESEKTAVIASVYFPQFVWLATGGVHGCKWTEAKVCKVFSGRKVILFPDLNMYDAWSAKALLVAAQSGCKIAVSKMLERLATDDEKAAGLDLADFLLKNQDCTSLALTDQDYPIIWDYTHKNSVA